MARTQQTARRSTGGKAPQRVTQANGIVVDGPDIDEHEAKKLHEIEEGEMRALLKHIDRKFTDKGAIFYAETKEEVIPEQVNWWSKFALCLVRYMDQSKMCVQKISLQAKLKSISTCCWTSSMNNSTTQWKSPRTFWSKVSYPTRSSGSSFVPTQPKSTARSMVNITLTDLPAYPLKYHPTPGGLREQLIERGRRFEKLAGMSFHCYNGIAFEQTPCGMSRYNIEGRVVVDTKTFHRLEANYAFSVAALKSREDKRRKQRHVHDDDADGETREMSLDLVPKNELDIDPLTEEQCMRASALVRGFSFAEKRWLDFFVDKLSAPAWNTDCFEQLVLPQTQKDLVQALVANHMKQRNDFDDVVKGKGKGLIMVLHGPPGVGKTPTAETVAEFTRRPLYMVSSGDLGTNSSTLDARLTRILDMASTWKAVLLIDEADVFLEHRSPHDMERNSLVSIFLRVLEYYEGILFLTSNRVNTFDDAFKSRIHVPLKYNDLTVDSRKQIWKNILSKMETGVHVDEAGYESLSQAEINGRQIKNVIRTAKSLAQFHKEKLSREKLEQVIQIQMEFEHELGADSKRLVNGHVVNGAIDGH